VACKTLLQRLFHDFVPQHNNDYACVTQSLQLRVSLRFAAPRYDAYCKIRDKTLTCCGIFAPFCTPEKMLIREIKVI
jgi:hypothetical protein